MRRIVPIALACLVLFGCDTVQLQYQTPAAAGDFSAADQQASDHFEYFALNESYVLVSPASTATPDKPKAASEAGGNAPQAGGAAKAKPAKKKVAHAARPAGASDGGGAPAPAPAPAPAAGDGTAQNPPATANDPLTGVMIDNVKWTAQVVPMPSSQYGMAVKGVSNFWKTTTIGVSKYPNSDLVSSVSSKAENLVPKRIGQIAGVVATAVKIAGAAVAGLPKLPLESFSFAVNDTTTTGSVNAAWNYELTFDSPLPPAGTVSMDDFLKNVQGKTVNYWPVPACRPATLTLYNKNNGKLYAFHIIVSSPEHVRLQPLSVDGKTDFGTVCAASTTGSTSPDTFGDLADDFTAVQQAVQTVKTAKAAPAAAASAAANNKPAN
jgi:hypothetical protein